MALTRISWYVPLETIVCSLMMSVATPGIVTVKFAGNPPGGTWIVWPPNVRSAISVEPWTPAHVASVRAPTKEAVTCVEVPGRTLTFASEAELSATPLAPLVEAASTSAVRALSRSARWRSLVSRSASDLKPPLGGNSPVSVMNMGPVRDVLTNAAKARPL